jgi:hypothetical protein
MWKLRLAPGFCSCHRNADEGFGKTGIMCSYNDETYGYGVYQNGSTPTKPAGQYEGVPSCANKGLLNDLAREAWVRFPFNFKTIEI